MDAWKKTWKWRAAQARFASESGASEIAPKRARSAMQRQFGCLGLSLLSACAGGNHKLDFVMQPDRIADERLGRLTRSAVENSLG
jgi:hypothetical protein